MAAAHQHNHVGAILVTLGVALAPLSFGYTIAFTSPVMAAITRPRSQGGVLTQEEMATFSAIVTLAAAAGSAAAGPCADRIGRQRTLVASMLPIFGGFAAIALGTTSTQLMAGRVATGVGIGVVSVVTPMYLAEISPPSLRGGLVCVSQLAIVTGILLVYVLGFELVSAEESPHERIQGWRLLAALGCGPPFLLIMLSPLIPESPHWLASTEYPDRLVGSLRCLRAVGARGGKAAAVAAEAAVQSEAAELQRSSKEASKEAVMELGRTVDTAGGENGEVVRAGMFGTLCMLCFGPSAVSKPFRIACALNVLQQVSGINVVNMFASSILGSAGVEDPQAASIWLACTNIVGTCCCIVLTEAVGRQPLLSIAAAGMGFASFALTVTGGKLAVAALILYIFAFAIGVGALPGLLANELLPMHVRGAGTGMAGTLNWIFAFLTVRSFEPMEAAVGHAAVFRMYAACCFGFALYVHIVVPETKGRSFRDIAAALSGD